MIDRIQRWTIAILMAVIIALGIACYIQDRQAEAARWIGSYPMANQHITWEGAGYQKYGEALE